MILGCMAAGWGLRPYNRTPEHLIVAGLGLALAVVVAATLKEYE